MHFGLLYVSVGPSMVTNVPLPWGMLIMGTLCIGEGKWSIWKNFVPSPQYSCKPETALKYSFKIIQIYIKFNFLFPHVNLNLHFTSILMPMGADTESVPVSSGVNSEWQ